MLSGLPGGFYILIARSWTCPVLLPARQSFPDATAQNEEPHEPEDQAITNASSYSRIGIYRSEADGSDCWHAELSGRKCSAAGRTGHRISVAYHLQRQLRR